MGLATCSSAYKQPRTTLLQRHWCNSQARTRARPATKSMPSSAMSIGKADLRLHKAPVQMCRVMGMQKESRY